MRYVDEAEVRVPPEPDASSFERFFRDEHERLLRAVFLVCGNAQEAEEIVQDAFLKVWERWDRVGQMDGRTAYLFKVAMNRFRNRVRGAARAARRPIQKLDPTDEEQTTVERMATLQALATLSPRQRAALVLTEMLGYSSQEAAAILRIKPVTVRVLASQGRAALRTTLRKNDA